MQNRTKEDIINFNWTYKERGECNMAKFLKFIVNTIMIVSIVVAASLLVPPLAGVTTLIVDDLDMETNLETGSVTYAWGLDAGELKVGDKILLQDERDMLYSISSVEGNEFVLEDTLSTDNEMITKELQGMIDKVVLTVPFLGYVSMALRTVEGLIIVGLSVVFVIILFVLAEIWRKEEEENWEEGEEADKKEAEGESDQKEELTENQNQGVETEESDKEEFGSADAVTSESGEVLEEKFEASENVVAADALEENVFVSVPADDCKGSKEKILAMPLYTKEELLERAKAAGDEPELIMDELSGVTFLDYSDIL